jgi:plastocyanin
MRRGGSVVLLAVLAVAGLAAGILVPGSGASSKGSHATSDSKTTTRVTVTATEFKFTLSRRSAPTGTVIFTVTNKGKIAHDFKIAGKKTPLLSPGRSATLRVTFSTTGRYPYLSTVSRQASHGMKGVFTVVFPPAPTTTTTTPYTPPTGPVGTANTTVTVDMFDNPKPLYVLSQTTIPSGTVTFVINNKCLGQCSFDLVGIKAGRVMSPGESETWTVPLPPGNYQFHCDILPSMKGTFTVTP